MRVADEDTVFQPLAPYRHDEGKGTSKSHPYIGNATTQTKQEEIVADSPGNSDIASHDCR